jgi:excisionase family DNA binding protein
MKNSEKLLTPTDVADRLQVNERTVTQWLRKGHLRGFKIGKEWRISPDDLQAFLEASANMPPDKPRSIA